jgi:ABC-2 type transport system ATP-binding protein
MALAILAEGLRKTFGRAVALDGLDLAVPEGTVCGLLGPNGAGKTTAVRILSTLLRADSGRALVAGIDVAADPRGVRAAIGLTSQHDAVDDTLSGRQNLEMFARLHHLRGRAACERADELLERFGLGDVATRPAKKYSGGMRRRLDLAASFVLAPRVLFLDEPTVGQDPRHRGEVWDVVRSLVAEGTTVLLTTHYLDEADRLADSVSVIDHGRVIASGTPAELKARAGGSQIDVVVGIEDVAVAALAVERACGCPATVDEDTRRITAPASDPVGTLSAVLRGLEDVGVVTEDLALRRPTLDEVFLQLTEREAVTA